MLQLKLTRLRETNFLFRLKEKCKSRKKEVVHIDFRIAITSEFSKVFRQKKIKKIEDYSSKILHLNRTQ